MSVWERVYKNMKSKVVQQLGPTSLTVPGVKISTRNQQLPSLFLGLALGTTYTKRTFFGQLGSELSRWNPENPNQKMDLSVFRVEKILSDSHREVSTGEEALSNFMSDRSDPACTLFFQPGRFLLPTTGIPSFISSYDGQKILHQSPSNKDIFQMYFTAQLKYLWEKATKYFSDVRRFQAGQIVVEYPDYYSSSDVKRYKEWLVEAAEKFFPPLLNSEEEALKLSDRFILVPESLVTLLHWVTNQVDSKLAAQEIDLKKLMVRYGMLPRLTDPLTFLIVTMGGTHSRVVRIKVQSLEHLASAKRAGETISVAHNYIGRTGFGGDHISCMFLEEEEEKRYGATAAHRVSTLSRKVLEDWGKMKQEDGKRHFEELASDSFAKVIDKLGEITLKTYSESPENTLIILGGQVFALPYFSNYFRTYLQSNRVPLARVVTPANDEIGIEKACEVFQFQTRGLGRLFSLKASLESDVAQKFTWKIGKVVESTLVDTLLDADFREWGPGHPREFTISFERGVKRLSLGYQQSAGGLSQLWANVLSKSRETSPIQVTLSTEGPDDLKIIKVKAEGNKQLTIDDFVVEMLIAGEPPSQFPLYDKVLKN